MSRLLFLSLPVLDLKASRGFFERLGFRFDGRFCDEHATCMVVSELAFVMLFERNQFAEFVTGPVADARRTTALTVAISAKNRKAVDDLADLAMTSGATRAKEPQDFGFMYQRSFLDLDGYFWEVLWMDQKQRRV